MTNHLALSDNGFLFDTRTGSTYSLNSTGTFLLRQLMAGTPPASLADALIDQFEVDREVAERDAAQFLFRLGDLQLIRDAGGDA